MASSSCSKAVSELVKLVCTQCDEHQPGRAPRIVSSGMDFNQLLDLPMICAAAQDRADKLKDDAEDGLDEEEIVEEDEEEALKVGEDFIIVNMDEEDDIESYHDGKVANADLLKKSIKDGHVVQVAQPQRFVDSLWRAVSELESKLGCLVGCTASIAPADAKVPIPLPGEKSDVSLFVLDGAMHWEMQWCDGEEKKEEFKLKAGDVMHLPCGVKALSAKASGKQSTYLTISAFQKWTWADVAGAVMQSALDEGRTTLPREMRRNLPRDFLASCGLQAEATSSASYQAGASSLAAAFRALADHVEASPEKLLPAAAHKLASTFIKSRLPPHPSLLQDKGPEPNMDCSLMGRGTGLFALLPFNGLEDPEVPEGFVMLCTPLFNKRSEHMMTDPDEEHHHHHHHHHHDEDEDKDDKEDEDENEVKGKASAKKSAACCKGHVFGLGWSKRAREGEDLEDSDNIDDEESSLGPVIPTSYSAVVSKVLNAVKESDAIPLKTLLKEVPHQDEDEVMRLAHMLWNEGFVVCISSGKGKAKRDEKSDEVAAKKTKK